MPSLTIENYVKAIYQLCLDAAEHRAATGQVAVALDVSPGTVTSMLKTLSETGLARYAPYEGVQLTAAGERLALRVLRRHRLIEQFLATTLDLSWDEVHDEAENMEHAVSDLLVDRIEAFLGYPKTDPHGDPIPTSEGVVRESPSISLSDVPVDTSFRLVRVLDQSPEFLQSLSQDGINLGVEGRVVRRDGASDCLEIEINDRPQKLDLNRASKLLVAQWA